MIAGTITSGLFGSDVLAYSLLTRTRQDSDVVAQIFASGAEVPSEMGLEHLAGVARLEGESSDLWAGLSYAHGFNSSFGAGLTWYGAQRSQSRRREGIVTTIDTDGSAAVDIDIGVADGEPAHAEAGRYRHGARVCPAQVIAITGDILYR